MAKKKGSKKGKQKKDNSLFSFIKASLVTIVAIGLAFVIMLKVFLMTQPPIPNLQNFKPNQVTQIYSEDGELIKTFTAYKFEPTHIKDVPKNLVNALIATEDKNFYKHQGYDLFGIVRSTFANISARRTVQGASTITQQLSRILFLSNERSFNRKIKEIIIASRIEKSLTKDQILEMYLNNVYLGSGAYGAAGAAASTVAVCLPSFAVIYLISLFFDQFLRLSVVASAFHGIQVCVIYLILSAGLKMLKQLEHSVFNIVILTTVAAAMVGCSIAAVSFSSIFYILFSGAAGLLVYAVQQLRKGEKKP